MSGTKSRPFAVNWVGFFVQIRVRRGEKLEGLNSGLVTFYFSDRRREWKTRRCDLSTA